MGHFHLQHQGFDLSRNKKDATKQGRKRKQKEKLNMYLRRKKEKGQVRLGTPAGPLETDGWQGFVGT